MRKRRSIEEGKALVAQFQASGMSQSQFAKKHGLNQQTLQRWIQKVQKRDGTTETRFVEVVDSHSNGVIVRVGEVEVRFNALPAPGYLVEVMQRLGKAC